MSTQELHNAAPFGSIATFHVVHAFERSLDALTRWVKARATRRELAKLTDSQLEDIGLYRGQIRTLR